MSAETGTVYPWKKGLSLSFFDYMKRNELPMYGQPGFGEKEKQVLKTVRDAGFVCGELSFSYEDYLRRFRLQDTVKALKDYCDSIGFELWSLHLPFGDYWDISAVSFRDAIEENEHLLRIAHDAGCSVAVIHPSFEPIAPECRAARFARCRDGIRILSDCAESLGIHLGVENLPRTCLGNTSEEMIRLLDGTGAHWLFDTNHSLSEDNVHFLSEMIRNGYVPCSLHISDYDFVDERHDLPGVGINKWHTLLDLLKEGGYTGPALYEIRHVVNPERILSFEQVAQNITDLLQGKIG